jgi:hypothetical protein
MYFSSTIKEGQKYMEQNINWIVRYFCIIADDLFGVLRQLDAIREPTEQAIKDMKASIDKQGSVN